jgi:hypothetical protein
MRSKLLTGKLRAAQDDPWDAEQRWRNRLCGWMERGQWNAWWGPAPDCEECLVPPELLDDADVEGEATFRLQHGAD